LKKLGKGLEEVSKWSWNSHRKSDYNFCLRLAGIIENIAITTQLEFS